MYLHHTCVTFSLLSYCWHTFKIPPLENKLATKIKTSYSMCCNRKTITNKIETIKHQILQTCLTVHADFIELPTSKNINKKKHKLLASCPTSLINFYRLHLAAAANIWPGFFLRSESPANYRCSRYYEPRDTVERRGPQHNAAASNIVIVNCGASAPALG